MRKKMTLLFLAVILSVAGMAAAQQTGTLDGTVKDEQGGVLPGVSVTVSGPALIGGSQNTTSGATGIFKFRTLPPGTYTVVFELQGFGTLTREGIIINVARSATLDTELKIGGVRETVTVTGESPIVDVRSTVTQTNIAEDLYDAVPTGRNPWVMAGLVPGVVTGQLDVGGTRGFQQYDLEVFGSDSNQKSFSIDGLKTNWTGGDGGSTMQYYDFGMYDEYNFQTASGTAESDVSGVYMNMVTKSGGNDLSGSAVGYYMGSGTQSSNIDSELEAAGLTGNEIDVSYDLNATIGGPILRDKAWFFGAVRWWRLDQFVAGAFNEDGSPGIDDNRIRNFMGKYTQQVTVNQKFSFMFNRNQKDRFHRGRGGQFPFSTDRATNLQDQPAQNFVADYNVVIGEAMFFDIRIGRMWGTFPFRYQPEVGTSLRDDVRLEDRTLGTAERAGTENFTNPNSRLQFNASLTYFLENGSGTHDFKFGAQISRAKHEDITVRNGDLILRSEGGIADSAVLFNSPNIDDQRVNDHGFFAQDTWTVKNRLTLNLGVRFDGINGRIPRQVSPTGTFVGERTVEEITNVPDWPLNVAPRLGFSYDLMGNGRTAIKGYWGRFYNQIGSNIPQQINPAAGDSSTIPWNDLNGDLFLEPGPSGTFADSPELDFSAFPGFGSGVATATTRFDPDADRPFSDEFNIGFSHEVAENMSVDVTYHRRQFRNGLGRIDEARPPEAYSPVQVTYDDRFAGPNQTITVYNLDPSLTQSRERLITNVDVLESNYNGVQFQYTKRMSNRWQLLAGLTLQRHEGFWHEGTYTDGGGVERDFNNPNSFLNMDNSRVFTDVPWVVTVSGSYLFPHDIVVAAKYTGRDGNPLRRRLSVPGLNQGTETVLVVPRGTDRTEVISKFIDLRIGKTFAIGGRVRVEGMLDIFNLLNANHVDRQNEVVGSRLGVPSQILNPRVLRVGARLTF